MTKNQIDYQAYLENVRHNQANEAEVLRHNTQTESLGYQEAQIAARNAETQARNAESQARSAAAAQTSAQASYLNALTNQRKQTFTEEQWNDPFGGGKATGITGNIISGITAATKFIRLVMGSDFN